MDIFKHISHRSVLLLIYSVGKVHKRGWMGLKFQVSSLKFQVVGLTVLSSSLLRRRFSFAELTFLFCGRQCFVDWNSLLECKTPEIGTIFNCKFMLLFFLTLLHREEASCDYSLDVYLV